MISRMNPRRELVPDTFRIVAERLPSGNVVLRQDADSGEAIILIPRDYVRAVCEGIYHVSMDGSAL